MSSLENDLPSQEMLATLEKWFTPISREVDLMNTVFYHNKAAYQDGNAPADKFRESIFKHYPQLTRCGLGLTIESPNQEFMHDLFIHVNRDSPSTFDILIVETQVNPEGRVSRKITNPSLRAIMESVPNWSSMAPERYEHFAIVNKAQVEPENLISGSLTDICVKNWDMAICTLNLFPR